jgi:hypothetical protein
MSVTRLSHFFILPILSVTCLCQWLILILLVSRDIFLFKLEHDVWKWSRSHTPCSHTAHITPKFGPKLDVFEGEHVHNWEFLTKFLIFWWHNSYKITETPPSPCSSRPNLGAHFFFYDFFDQNSFFTSNSITYYNTSPFFAPFEGLPLFSPLCERTLLATHVVHVLNRQFSCAATPLRYATP